MSEQPSLAAQRRDNLAKARAVKAERRANGTYSMSAVHAKLDLQHQAIDALLHSQVNLVGLVEELAQMNLLMAQLLANPPTRTAAVAETLARMGTARPADGTRDLGYQDRMEAQQAYQAHERPNEPQTVTAPTAAFIAQLHDDLVDTRQIPRGTESDLDAPYDPTAMASELALMAAEDDEPPPPPDEWEMWSRRLSTFRGQRMWHPSWGPRPGQDGCRVPYEMLNGGAR